MAICPLCRAEVLALDARDLAGRLRFVDVQDPGFVPPPGCTRADMLERIHARTADGRITVGVQSLRLAYRAVGLGWAVAATGWPLLDRASERTYRWLAAHRGRTPRWMLRGFVALVLPRGTRADALVETAARAAAQARGGTGACRTSTAGSAR